MTETSPDPIRLSPKAVVAWWRTLQDLDPDTGHARPDRTCRLDRAALADLRRCEGLADAVMVRAFRDLLRRFPGLTEQHHPQLTRLAIAAIVSAHVGKEVHDKPVARQLGPASPEADGTAIMSELRFRRLLQVRGEEDLLRAMLRVVKLLKGRVHLESLVSAILWWNDRTRRIWAFQYFDAVDALPADAASGDLRAAPADAPPAAPAAPAD